MGIAKDFSSIHHKDWEIYFSQSYPNGALKLPELANLLQLTAASHADSGGVGFSDLAVDKQSWVLNRLRIEIDEMPVWTNTIAIKTWIEELKGFKSTRNFEVSLHGKKCIGVSSLWAVFNMEKRRPEAMSIDTSHVMTYPDDHATLVENRKVDSDFEATASFDGKVVFSDLDIVKHVNNTKYLEWCLNQIDPAIILENRIKAIDLNFLKELSLNDDFLIEKLEEEDIIKFKISKEGKICFVCYIEIK